MTTTARASTIGTMALTQALLPQFRQRKAGVIVNVTSSVTLKPIPLVASYTATKAARSRRQGLELEAYAHLAKSVLARFGDGGPITHAQDVAEAVWRAVTDPSAPMRIPAGADALSLAGLS